VGSLQRSARPLAICNGPILLRGGRGREGGEERREREGKEREREKEGR